MILKSKHRKALIVAASLAIISSLAGCSDRNTGSISGRYYNYDIRETDTAYAYRGASPYAAVLSRCVRVTTAADSCPLTTLPFIGDGETPATVEQIMERVLVTHDWMGARFEQVLRSAPDSLLNLFSSTTAILMGSTVRPSFYTRLNGAIQIDPIYLWSSVEEKRSISKEDDFRSEFGSDLQFWFLTRLAGPDGESLAPFYSLDDESVRPVDDLRVPLIRLLFHELSHATDFMPRDQIGNLDTSLSVYDAIDSVRDSWLSNSLRVTNPLTSAALYDFAQVRFRGEEATAQQQTTTAIDMGELMEADGAIQFYSYTSQYEDLAQLTESVMMGFHYGAIINAGFTQKPVDLDNYTCADLLVGWGQRNRLSDPLVYVRAGTAADLVIDLTPEMVSFIDSGFGNVEAMDNTIDWCNNQKPDAFVAADVQTRSSSSRKSLRSGPDFREMIRIENTVHPDSLQHD